jgi:hypothetical protein
MTDLYLDPITHDLMLTGEGIRATSSVLEDAAQRIKVRILIFLGEWLLDSREGVPYYQQILTKTSKVAVDAIFRAKIKEEPLVFQVVSFSSNLSTSDRKYTLSFEVLLTSGETLTDDITLEI